MLLVLDRDALRLGAPVRTSTAWSSPVGAAARVASIGANAGSGAASFVVVVEDYVVEADGDNTVFTWTIAIERKSFFALPFKALSPVLELAFGRTAPDGKRYFAK